MKQVVMVMLGVTSMALCAADALKPIEVQLDALVSAGHVQGLACSEKAIYVAHMKGIEVLDWNGRHVKSVEAPCHLGGIAYDNGLIYGAIILRDRKERAVPGMIRVWNEDFKVVRERRFPINMGSVGVLNGTVYAATDRWMKAAGDHDLCSMKTLDLELNEKANVDIDLGYKIRYGIQTIATDGKELFLFCYGGTSRIAPSLKNPVNMKDVLPKGLRGAEGFAAVPKAISGSDQTVFMTVEALNGGMKAWRADSKKNPPRLRFHFWLWKDGKFTKHEI